MEALRPKTTRRTASRLALISLTVAIVASFSAAQTSQPASLIPATGEASLVDRQRSIHERFVRLESTMLKLTKLLAEKEPEKAERVRSALDLSGKQRIKSRADEIVAMLRSAKFSEADNQQEKLLGDLDELLKLLTNPTNELDSRRAERQKIEQLKRQIRELIEEQTQHLYRTQHAEQKLEGEKSESGGAPREEAAEMLRKIEQMQRETQRKAGDVGRDMQGKNAKPGEESKQRPGAEEMEKAADEMQQAADKMSEQQPADARDRQKKALDEMQKALDELDDALRQVRKEEMEETLAALEARLQQLLAREKEIRERVTALHARMAAGHDRADELALAETAQSQRDVEQEAAATLRILVDEGTTVIVPELMRQMGADMRDVADRLARADLSETTRKTIDDIITQLEEILAAVEKKRLENQQEEQDQQQQPGQQQGPQPLLPTSAELKLMRSSQVRLMERMPDESVASDGDPAQAHAAADAQVERTARELADRQRQLADLARRMNERKQ